MNVGERDHTSTTRAIAVCRRGIAAGQTPFGAVLVRDGQVLAESHNTVWRDGGPTAHAEVNCLRAACRALHAIALDGATIYSTCEPCPMCLAAAHWAKVSRVVFGAAIADAAGAGFAELPVAPATLAALGHSPLKVEGGVLRDECAALLRERHAAGLSGAY